MMDIITGKTRPDSGRVWFGQNIDLLRLNEPQIAQAGRSKMKKGTSAPKRTPISINARLSSARPSSSLRNNFV